MKKLVFLFGVLFSLIFLSGVVSAIECTHTYPPPTGYSTKIFYGGPGSWMSCSKPYVVSWLGLKCCLSNYGDLCVVEGYNYSRGVNVVGRFYEACREPVCGDGVQKPEEDCDDGNTEDLDGCPSNCLFEVGTCTDGIQNQDETGIDCGGSCGPCDSCGNSAVDPGEVCDDGNQISGDGCSGDCLHEKECAPYKGGTYSDARFWWDKFDGTTTSDPLYEIVARWGGLVIYPSSFSQWTSCAAGDKRTWEHFFTNKDYCTGSNYNYSRGPYHSQYTQPGVMLIMRYQLCREYIPPCGNGFKFGDEECDDGNMADGDGCSSTCENEAVEPLEPSQTIYWQNLRANKPPISEAEDGDTVLINSSNSPIEESDKNHTIYEVDVAIWPFEGETEITSYDSKSIFTHKFVDVDDPGDFGEFIVKLNPMTGTQDEEISVNELKVNKNQDDEDSEVAISKIGSIDDPSEGLIVAPEQTFTLEATAWDVDDFIDVWWTVDGSPHGAVVEGFAEIFDSDYSDLQTTYEFPEGSRGGHTICVHAKGVTRGEEVENCIEVEIPCEGVCVNAIITSPKDFINSNWVTFDARESNVQNCSIIDFDGADEVADIGTWFCKEVHAPTPNFDPDFNKPELGSEYTLDVQWFIDETPLMPNPISWDSEFSGGYAFIFNKFFPEIRGEHQAKLVLNYTEL